MNEAEQINKADDFNSKHNPGVLVKVDQAGFDRQAKTSCLAYYCFKKKKAVIQIDGLQLVDLDSVFPLEQPKNSVRDDLIKKMVTGYRAISTQYMNHAKDILTAAEYLEFEKIIRCENG